MHEPTGTVRETAILLTWYHEADTLEQVNAGIEGAYSWRGFVRAVHRVGLTHGAGPGEPTGSRDDDGRRRGLAAPTRRRGGMADYPRIPYGWADFRAIRLEGRLYVDKTRFIRRLEEERYVFLIRPRRFGKSLWVSVLENYYDRNRAAEFDALFGGTDVGRRPTDARHRYVVLRFDFSAFEDTPETLRERFETYCDTVLYYALERNRDLFPEAVRRRILAPPAPCS